MMLRRALVGLPSAALVGLLIHVVAAGFGHVPGLAHAPVLFDTLATGLALAALTAFLRAALCTGHGSIATKSPGAQSVVFLGAAGFAAYAALELFEGHGLAAGLPALLACLPAAALVARLARAVHAVLFAAGAAFAEFAQATLAAAPGALARRAAQYRLEPALPALRARRGRAPPRFA